MISTIKTDESEILFRRESSCFDADIIKQLILWHRMLVQRQNLFNTTITRNRDIHLCAKGED